MKTIVIRGCLIRVTKEQARKLEALERIALQQDWAKNQLP